jgi:hypothetical protein
MMGHLRHAAHMGEVTYTKKIPEGKKPCMGLILKQYES